MDKKNKIIDNIRCEAREIFSNIGYPTPKDEMWKHTNTENFSVCEKGEAIRDDFNYNDIHLTDDFYNIFIYNGVVIECDKTPTGIKLISYKDINSSLDADSRFLRISDFLSNGVVAHNVSSFVDVLHLTIEEDQKIKQPINIVNITDHLDSSKIIFPRIFIHAKENSKAQIFIQNLNTESECTINSVLEFCCGSRSNIDIVQISELTKQEMIDSIFIEQDSDSKINFLSTTIGGKLHRANISSKINGQNCENNFKTLILGSNNDHIDYHVDINHKRGDSKNNFICKSILRDKASGVFNGKIMVSQNASGTDSTLNNNNLLLSDQAKMQSNPQLEIYCEDVKCKHGSTTGNLDNEAMFYLRSRGINELDAKSILIEGFISEFIPSINQDFLSLNKKIKTWM